MLHAELRLREKNIVLAVLPFVDTGTNVYQKPNIPPAKAAHAIVSKERLMSLQIYRLGYQILILQQIPQKEACGIDSDVDEPIALVDCTVFGSAKNAVILGLQGIIPLTGPGP